MSEQNQGQFFDEIAMARQPVYDRRLSVYGFELLYRGPQAQAQHLDDMESARAILNALIGFGIRDLAGDRPAFVNLSQEIIVSGQVALLPKESVVLEVLESVEPLPEVLEVLRSLAHAGYRIALDDFVAGAGRDQFLPLAHIVKIDALAHPSSDALARQVRMCRAPARLLLAEKVEDYKTLRLCRALGFDLFQGYFLCAPDILRARELRHNRATLIALLQKLQDPAVSYTDLEKIVNRDVTLAHRLLRFIRSAHLGLESPIASIRQALLFLGVRRVAALGCLMAMAESNDKPPHLLRLAVERAKMCELLAAAAHEIQQERFFTTGLFSVLDAVMDAPMEKVLEGLPLQEDIKAALMGADPGSVLTQALDCVQSFEAGDFENAEFGGLNAKEIATAYRTALAWAAESDVQAA